MRRIFTISALLLLALAAWGQNDAEGFKARYDRHVRAVGSAGVGVETILDRWEAAFPDDPAMLEGRYKFCLAMSVNSSVVARDRARYLPGVEVEAVVVARRRVEIDDPVVWRRIRRPERQGE